MAKKWTPKALQDMGQERLCYKAMRETQEYVAFEMRKALVDSADIFMHTIGMSMVPACVYRYGCNQVKSCGFFKAFRAHEAGREETLWGRYLVYDDFLKGRRV